MLTWTVYRHLNHLPGFQCTVYRDGQVAVFECFSAFLKKPLTEEGEENKDVALKMIHRRHKLDLHFEGAFLNKEKCII